jgi:hypothetical protein
MMAGPDTILFMWTVYDHPSDFPDWFVARKFEITGQGPVVGNAVIWAATLPEVRRMIAEIDPDASACLPRYDNDHPNVVETWL